MNKKERLIQFNRGIIIETAERLFDEKGVKETTMDDIAKNSDCSKSTIYVYFKSKEEIYNHIIFSHMCHLRDVTKECIQKSKGFEEAYHSICNELVKIYKLHPQFFIRMLGNISIDEKELEEDITLQQIYEVGEEINDCMISLFEEGVQEHYLRSDLLILPAVYTLWASLANTIMLAHQKEAYIYKRIGMDREQFIQFSFHLLLDSVKGRER